MYKQAYFFNEFFPIFIFEKDGLCACHDEKVND